MKKKKLKLNKETIASLNSLEMSALQGGDRTDGCPPFIDTIYNDPATSPPPPQTLWNTQCGANCTTYGNACF